jgi:Domain of unknown function (DUF4384)
MSSVAPHLTLLEFDRLSLGHLAPAEAAPLLAHLDVCPVCHEQQNVRLALAGQFAREVLPRSLPVIRQRLMPQRLMARRRIAFWALALSPAACGALIAVLILRRGPGGGPDDEGAVAKPVAQLLGDVAVKGRGDLLTYVRQEGKVKRLAPGSLVAAGDALRFVVETGDNRYLLVAGVDGGGHANAYYPRDQWQGSPVPPHVRFEVPGSLVLDEAAGPERIFALLSTRPLPGDGVRQVLEDLARRGPQAIRAWNSPVVAVAETSSILLEKRPPPP